LGFGGFDNFSFYYGIRLPRRKTFTLNLAICYIKNASHQGFANPTRQATSIIKHKSRVHQLALQPLKLSHNLRPDHRSMALDFQILFVFCPFAV